MTPHRKDTLLTLLGLLLLCGAAWFTAAPSLQGPFLFDDLSGVITVASTRTPSDILQWRQFWLDESTGYRPVRYVSLILDWHFGRGSPAVFHRTNLILHGLCGVLLWLLLRRLRFGATGALLAALLFLVHPLQSAAVSNISGRKDLLAALFYLCALHANLSASRHSGRPLRALFTGGFLLAAALSFLSKEIALTLPLTSLLCDRVEAGRGGSLFHGWPDILRARAWFYGILGAGGLLGLLDKVFLRPGTHVPLNRALDLVSNLPLALQTLAWHVRKVWLPWPHTADTRGLFPDRTFWANGQPNPANWSEIWNGGGSAVTLVGLLLLAGWLLAARRAAPKRRGAIAAGTALFLVTLLPVLNLIRLNEPVAEHYLYLPLAGWAIALTAALVHIDKNNGNTPRLTGSTALLLLALALAVTARVRSAVWTSPERLWTSVVASNRSTSRGWNNLAQLRLAAGDSLGGESALRLAQALEPRSPRVTANLIALEYGHGRFAAAEQLGETALARSPGNKLLISLQGRTLLAQGRAEEARALLERLVETDDHGDLPYELWQADLGAARLLTGDASGAAGILEAVVADHTAAPEAWTNLGAAYSLLQRYDRAESALRRALALPGVSGQAHRNLAVVLLHTGRAQSASDELAAARAAGVTIPASLTAAVEAALAAEPSGTP